MFVDGIVVYDTTLSGTIINESSSVIIAGFLNGPGNVQGGYLDGKMDNLSLWNVGLTDLDIQNYMNCPPTGSEEGLVGYWNFEEGRGNEALDLSPNENNGTS